MRSVDEFAKMKGISPSRVRALIEAGDVEAHRVGRSWVIDDSALRWEPAESRPLSQSNAWALISAIDNHGQLPPSLRDAERARLRERLGRLRSSDKPAALLRSWLPRRARAVDYQANASALGYLRDDRRIALSGISAPESFMSAQAELEGYVLERDAEDLVEDHYLAPGSRNNVRLHIVPERLPDVSVGLIAADLADWHRPREDGQAARLLSQAIS